MPDIFEDINCCVCDNKNPADFKVLYQKEKFSVVECNKCSFTFIPPYFRKQISYENYKDENVANAVRNGNNFVKIERHKLRYDLIKKYKPSGSLFDLGAGWGHFMLTGQMLGYDVYGIEISEQPYLYSKNDLKLPVDHIDFFDMKEDKKFDVVTAFHVVEHLNDPREVLRQLGHRLAPGGRLVVEVPSADDALLTLYESNEFQRFTYWSQHLFLFNIQTLQMLVKQAGLRLLAVEQIQRYQLSNHLYWLSRGKPGGHKLWGFLNSTELHRAYTASLAAVGKCDTLVAHIG